METRDSFLLEAVCLQDLGIFNKGETYTLLIEKRYEDYVPVGSFSAANSVTNSGHRYDTIEEFLEDFEF